MMYVGVVLHFRRPKKGNWIRRAGEVGPKERTKKSENNDCN